METKITTDEGITKVKINGDIDSTTVGNVKKEVDLLAQTKGSKILMNMTEVSYMSSAGLRMLLSLYRNIQNHQGKLILVGLSEELQDTMTTTGFLNFFTTAETLDEGMEKLLEETNEPK